MNTLTSLFITDNAIDVGVSTSAAAEYLKQFFRKVFMTDRQDLIKRHSRKNLLVDANLFVVVIVGNTSREFLAKVKVIRHYILEDYNLLITQI